MQAAQTAEPSNAQPPLEKLQELIHDMDQSRISRKNIEVLLPVFQYLLTKADQLEHHAVNELSLDLLRFTSEMRRGDPAIRRAYLRPVFQQAHDAINHLPLKQQNQSTKDMLNEVLNEEEGEREA